MNSNSAAASYMETEFDRSAVAEMQDPAKSNSIIDLDSIRRMLWRQRRVLIIITAIALPIGLIITLLLTPRYSATASVRIENQTPQVFEGQELSPYIDYRFLGRYMNTLKEVLTSRSMAESVVNSLELQNEDGFFEQSDIDPEGLSEKQRTSIAQAIVASGVSMDVPNDNNVARISFVSTSPEWAAKIANAYVDNFMASQNNQKARENEYAVKLVNQEIASTKAKLADAERRALEYASRNDIIDPGTSASQAEVDSAAPPSITTSNLLATNEEFISARNRRILAEQRWNAAQKNPVADLPEGQNNPALQNLLQQRSQIRGEIAELEVRYLPDHPAIAERREQLDAIDAGIATTRENIKSALRNEYQIALAQEQQLREARSTLTDETLSEQARRVQLGIISRDSQALRSRLTYLLNRLGQIESASDITSSSISLVDPATVPRQPVSPNLVTNLLASLFIGFVVAVGLAALREILDDTIYSPDDTEARLGLALLGATPLVTNETDEQLGDVHSEIGEAYSSMRSAVDVATGGRVNKVISVTSSMPGEGKTTTSCALAQDFARIGRSVLLVDGDIRNPAVHNWFGIKNERGFTNVLLNREAIAGNVQKSDLPKLDILLCGPIPQQPAQLLSSDALPEFIEMVGKQYDVVIVDSPPVLGLADAPALARNADYTLIVVEAGRARFSIVRKSIRRLQSVGARLAGITVTKLDFNQPGHGYSYSYYNYGKAEAQDVGKI